MPAVFLAVVCFLVVVAFLAGAFRAVVVRRAVALRVLLLFCCASHGARHSNAEKIIRSSLFIESERLGVVRSSVGRYCPMSFDSTSCDDTCV